jgi:predicted nucleic acid-binding protein
LRAVLDTCVLKLATFPRRNNPAALAATLGFRGCLEWWASPAILEEYAAVLADEPAILEQVYLCIQLCWPLTTLAIIRHEPDNRFLECALACHADYLITVNTARGHFDQPSYGSVRVMTPGQFVNSAAVVPLIQRLEQDPERSAS